MIGGTYSYKRYNHIVENKREPGITYLYQYFRGYVKNMGDGMYAMRTVEPDIDYIPINKLFTSQRTARVEDIEYEQEYERDRAHEQPVNVIKRGGKYILIEGAERVIALKLRGVKRVKARIFDLDKPKT